MADPSAPLRLTLDAPPFPVRVSVSDDSAGRPSLTVEAGGRSRSYSLGGATHDDWLDLQAQIAVDFGTRAPLNRRPASPPSFQAPLRPLLTETLSPRMRYGYGDPAVVRTPDGYRLLVTSNDAPDAFPILRSPDLETWELSGFVFPQGRTPAWALTGEGAADFWAPEMHRVARAYWVCFSARLPDRSLAIGLARAATPDGPFRAADAPLVTGGVIDAHLVLDRDGAPLLIWKSDANAVWPRRLVELLHHRPELIARVFPGPADARTAALAAALQPWIGALEAMQQFFALQPLIEAATDDFAGFRSRIGALAGAGDRALDEAVAAVLDATTTHIWAQRLNADGTALVGPRTSILQNDLAWEAHLIEGPWISEVDGRYWLFYAGNDFSTEHYGIGAAVAEHPLGPYRKLAEPLLRSTAEWRGPGHPSVTRGPGGELRMLLHAFRPGQMGYGVFRALLTAELKVDGDHVRVV